MLGQAGSSGSLGAQGAREGASREGRVPGSLPSQGAQSQLLARLLRISQEGIGESPSVQGFSLPVSLLKPIHDTFFRRIISEVGLR